MTTQASTRPIQSSIVAATARQAGKAVAKTADFKGALAQAQQPFPAASPRAARANIASMALLAQAQELQDTSRPRPRTVSLRAPQPSFSRPASGDTEFRARIALLESGQEPGMGYGARNASSGALGRYQFMNIALRDIGWQDSRGQWTEAAGRHGVSSDAGFLDNPAAQEAAMGTYLQRKASQLAANGAMGAAGTVVTGINGGSVPITEAGLIAAAHRRGASSVMRWLEHRTRTPDAPVPDSQRTAFANVEQRMRDFAGVPYAAPAMGVASLGRGAPSI